MRIAVVHSFYSSALPSGENRVVEDQVAALRAAGHEVLLLGRHTDREQQSPLYPVKAAIRVATGRGPDPSERLRAFAPDVVHIHNLFPNIGTAWLRHWTGPVVVSVHNYRAVCSNGLLFRDGHECRECVDHGPLRAVVHRCYRDSSVATLPVAWSRPRDGVFLLERADAVITTSLASDDLLRDVVPRDLPTVVIPNFGSGEGVRPLPVEDRSGWVAIGRFSAEKGFVELVREWPDGVSLTIIGDGPLDAEVHQAALGTGITVLASIARDELREFLPSRLGLVIPSLWPEAAPQVVVEAMRVGLPVIANASNGVARLVESTGTGAAYSDAQSLGRALQLVEARCDALSTAAWQHYQDNWTSEIWLASMTELYRRLVGGIK